MPDMVIPNEGKQRWLDRLFKESADAGDIINVRIFTNNFTPSDTTVLADFTQAAWTGYAAVVLTPATFNAATVVANVGQAQYPTAPSFTMTAGSPVTAYGWYIEDPDTGVCLATQLFSTPRSMTPGATISLDPFIIKDKTFA